MSQTPTKETIRRVMSNLGKRGTGAAKRRGGKNWKKYYQRLARRRAP